MSKEAQAEPVAATNTVRLHRVLAAKPERVYRAFLDADALAKWLPPNGFTANVHEMNAKVGGTFRMSFTNFTNGKSHSFGGEYLEGGLLSRLAAVAEQPGHAHRARDRRIDPARLRRTGGRKRLVDGLKSIETDARAGRGHPHRSCCGR
jgi:uncharacterized protein YndB with AHSA1/START domain